jgi:hypothetical protein
MFFQFLNLLRYFTKFVLPCIQNVAIWHIWCVIRTLKIIRMDHKTYSICNNTHIHKHVHIFLPKSNEYNEHTCVYNLVLCERNWHFLYFIWNPSGSIWPYLEMTRGDTGITRQVSTILSNEKGFPFVNWWTRFRLEEGILDP